TRQSQSLSQTRRWLFLVLMALAERPGNEGRKIVMEATRKFLAELGLPCQDAYALPSSSKRFPDEAQYRFEIPSVEGPRCLRAVIEEAQRHRLTIHRISQGSGIMLLTDDEIKDTLRMAKDQQMEVSLFVGP